MMVIHNLCIDCRDTAEIDGNTELNDEENEEEDHIGPMMEGYGDLNIPPELEGHIPGYETASSDWQLVFGEKKRQAMLDEYFPLIDYQQSI